MIDTVVFRIGNVNAHNSLFKLLLKETYQQQKSMLMAVNIDDIINEKPKMIFELIKQYGKEYYKTARGKFYIPSSHYMVTYQLTADYIEINLSIPKYLFGNNIAQFVCSRYNKDFQYFYHNEIKNNLAESFERLREFIKRFLNENFVSQYLIDINLNDITIERIDLCYNQIFDTKRDAFRYLSYLRRFEKPNNTLRSNRMQDYNTGISYKGDGYFFKIYHKGEDYRVHDRKHHNSMNNVMYKNITAMTKDELVIYNKMKEAGGGTPQEFDIEKLQDFGDRILRYELTFRKKLMSRIYKDSAFNTNDPAIFNYLKIWKKLESRLKSKHGEELSREETKFHVEFRKYMRKTHNFYLWPSDYITHKEKHCRWSDDFAEATFSEKLFRSMGEYFMKYINFFNIKEMDNNSHIIEKIDAHNKRVRLNRLKFKRSNYTAHEWRQLSGKLINKKSIMLYVSQIDKYGSIDQWAKKDELKPYTVRRIVAELEEIGIHKKSVNEPINFNVRWNFEKYYDFEYKYPKVLKYGKKGVYER